MAVLPSQIIGSFGDIVESVKDEVTKLPGDMGKAALESVGLSTGNKPGQKVASPQAVPGEAQNKSSDKWDTFDKVDNQQVKQAVAREALAALMKRSQNKEPSVWEKNQQEEKQKKEQEAAQAKVAAMSQIPQTGAKRAKGDLYGKKAKQTQVEIKNRTD